MAEDGTHFKAAGPSITGLPVADRNMQLAIESQGLERMVPTFYDPAEVDVPALLTPKDPMPDDVTGVSYTLPDVVSIWFDAYAGAEPTINFTDIIQGVGCAAFMLEPDEIPRVKGLIEALALQIGEGSNPPSINGGFADEVKNCLQTIFNNNEPISARPLMAFTIGTFWLLGFVDQPKRRRGGVSPLGFITELVQHYARLAYLPQ